jgi:hypothetical protein
MVDNATLVREFEGVAVITFFSATSKASRLPAAPTSRAMSMKRLDCSGLSCLGFLRAVMTRALSDFSGLANPNSCANEWPESVSTSCLIGPLRWKNRLPKAKKAFARINLSRVGEQYDRRFLRRQPAGLLASCCLCRPLHKYARRPANPASLRRGRYSERNQLQVGPRNDNKRCNSVSKSYPRIGSKAESGTDRSRIWCDWQWMIRCKSLQQILRRGAQEIRPLSRSGQTRPVLRFAPLSHNLSCATTFPTNNWMR